MCFAAGCQSMLSDNKADNGKESACMRAVCLLVGPWDYRICACKGHRLIDPEMCGLTQWGFFHARDIPKNHWGDTKYTHTRTHART